MGQEADGLVIETDDGQRSDLERAVAFERLIADVSATFVNTSPDAVDGKIMEAIRRAAEFLDLDRVQVAQLSRDGLAITHQWTREEAWRVPSFVPAEAIPGVVATARRGEAIVVSRLGDLAFETDREFIARFGAKSAVILPMLVGGQFLGGAGFDAIRAEHPWPADTVARLRLIVEIIANALARKQGDLELRAMLAENEGLRQRLERENVYLQQEIETGQNYGEIVGRSPALHAVLHKVAQVAAADVPVLLLGETGTGKELIARAIHARSRRGSRPLIAVNCAALPPSLIESELFGHEKGAFTGATQLRPGRFELADGSTLFLDEIGDLDPALQAKLLRALQDGEITRLGGSVARKTNVRVIAATNRDLGAAMDAGRFREDLYYRLSVFPIEMPPLRARREDIPLLVWHLLQSRQRELGRDVRSIPEPVMEALLAYDWPGNIRELQNVIDRALILTSGPTLCLDGAFTVLRTPRGDATRAQAGAATEAGLVERLADAERIHIERALRRCDWRIEGAGQAAARLGLRPSTLRSRMRRLGLRRPGSGA